MLPRMPASVKSKKVPTGLLATAWHLGVLNLVVNSLGNLNLVDLTPARALPPRCMARLGQLAQ